jgi:hypothetical protein
MTVSLKLIPLLAALAAAPAFAAEPDPHAGHHPAPAAAATPAAKPEVKPDTAQGCPMMGGKMMGGQMAPQAGESGPGGAASTKGGQAGGMAKGGMMDGKDMPCMHTPPAGAADAPPPKPAPK